MTKLLFQFLFLLLLSFPSFAQVAPPVVENHLIGEYLRIPKTHSSVSVKYTGPTVHYLTSGASIQLSSLWTVKPNRPGTLSAVTRYFKLGRNGVSSALMMVEGDAPTPAIPVEAGIYTYRITRQFVYSNPTVAGDFDTVFYKDVTITVKPNKSAWAYAGNDTLIFQDMESKYMIGGVWVPTPQQKVILSAKGSTGGTSWAWTKTKAPAGDKSTILNPTAEATEVSGIRAGEYEFTLTMNGKLVDQMTVIYRNKKYEYMASGCRTGAPVVHVLPPTKAPTLGANGQYYANWNYPYVAKYILETTGQTLKGGDHIVLNAERAPGVPIDSVTRVWLDGFGGRKDCPVVVRTETKTPIVLKGDGSTMVFGGGDQLKSSCIYFTVDGTYWRSSGTPYSFRFDNSNKMSRTAVPTQVTPLSFDFASSFTFRGFRSIGGGSIKLKMEAHMRAPRQLRFFSYDSIVLSDIWQSKVNNEGYYVLSTASEGYKSDEQYSTPPRGKHIQLKNILIDSTMWDGLQITNCHKDALVENVFAWRTGKMDKYGQNLAINFGGTIQGKVINNVVKDSHGKGINAHTNALDNYTTEIAGNVLDSVGYALATGKFESDPLLATGSFAYPEYIRWGKVNVHHNVITMRSTTRSAISLAYMNGIGMNASSSVNDNIFVHPDAVRLNRYAPGKGLVAVGFNDKIVTPHTGNYGTFNRTFQWAIIGVEETPTGYKIKGSINGNYKEWTSIADMNSELKKAAGAGANTPPVIEAQPETVITLPLDKTTLIPVVTDAESNALTYLWTKLSALSANFAAATEKDLSLTGMAEGQHSFRLLVNDGKDTVSQVFTVKVLPGNTSVNLLPTASAGEDLSVTGAEADLSGAGTDPEGGVVTYLWKVLDGAQGVLIEDSTAAVTGITMAAHGVYTFELTVTDDKGGKAVDSVTVERFVPTFFSAKKVIKVNLYGGTNPIDHPEWNNWNVSSSLTFQNFAFSNASLSSVSAVLSSNRGVKDNGTTYGDGMAPAPVLRYSSYESAARTLTLSGLSPQKYYELHLFGSRNASPGQHTVFRIDKNDELVNTYKNMLSPVHFSQLLPDSAGNIVVTIQSAEQYNYLNGFMLTELQTAPVNAIPMAVAGSDMQLPYQTPSVQLSGGGTDNDGSIQKFAWSQVSGPSGAQFGDRTVADPVVNNLSEGTYTFRLTVADEDGAHAFDEVQVVVAGLEAASGARLLKVNVTNTTGGSANAGWNHWNVKATGTASGLQFTDNSGSAVSLALSKSDLVRDNGSVYGGGMAPEEVLRTTSYATTARTLTFTGLSPTALYSLEFYASRANKGNATTFTIGAKAVTVVTDNNKKDKAQFTGLHADASGMLVVHITGTGIYNYLNGFILTEQAPANPPPAARQGGATLASEVTTPAASVAAVPRLVAVEAKGLSLRVAPNPSTTKFTLSISYAGNESLQLRVSDALGRVVERRTLPAHTPVISLGEKWNAGTYYAELIGGNQKVVVKLLKTVR